MKRFLIALALVLPMLSFAQANCQNGYVITNSLDTLRGLIDVKGSKLTPVNVKFKIGDFLPIILSKTGPYNSGCRILFVKY